MSISKEAYLKTSQVRRNPIDFRQNKPIEPLNSNEALHLHLLTQLIMIEIPYHISAFRHLVSSYIPPS